MKCRMILSFLAVVLVVDLNAQMVVEDPIAIAQDAVNQAINLAKYVEMVNNQIQQIETMTKELEQVTAYTEAFGDPSKLLNIAGADELISRIGNFESGSKLVDLQQSASGSEALKNTSNGLYSAIVPIQIGGKEIGRNLDLYKKHGALEATVSNYSDIHDQSIQRATAARKNLSKTATALQAASTDAEVQKLQGVIAAQSAELESLQSEVANAATHVLVQDVQNRTDSEKQDEARIEADVAEWNHVNREFDAALSLPGQRKK